MKKIIISKHAYEQMHERGATEDEVIISIRSGVAEPADKGRLLYRKNFQYQRKWRGKHYILKQVAPIVVEEYGRIIAVTVFVFYFQEVQDEN